jgi:hypothetical protein
MKQKDTIIPSTTFFIGQLVWLKGSNIKIIHPKAKLALKHYSPFKILFISPIDSYLQLPPFWHIHPVFHNALLTPYKETSEHGKNFTYPPPEVINNKD